MNVKSSKIKTADNTVALSVRLPEALKRRAAISAAREGISLNAFITQTLDAACPQENPFADMAQLLAAAAAAYDADAPKAEIAALRHNMRRLAEKLAADLADAPIQEPDQE